MWSLALDSLGVATLCKSCLYNFCVLESTFFIGTYLDSCLVWCFCSIIVQYSWFTISMLLDWKEMCLVPGNHAICATTQFIYLSTKAISPFAHMLILCDTALVCCFLMVWVGSPLHFRNWCFCVVWFLMFTLSFSLPLTMWGYSPLLMFFGQYMGYFSS